MTENSSLKDTIAGAMTRFIKNYLESAGRAPLWKKPVIKYAHARRREFQELKKIVHEEHYMPQDILKNPVAVLSYFLPFTSRVEESNIDGDMASREWAEAYIRTNDMCSRLNEEIVLTIEDLGYRAAFPGDAGMSSNDAFKSRWSQRHIAWIAGQGTFGINNMLISSQGSCGRYFSVVTNLPVGTDEIQREPSCLYKRFGTCGVCVKRCPSGALTIRGFDAEKCGRTCVMNARMLGMPDAHVCGKCAVGLPCSYRNPIAA
jgi:epoxyqueuosine reductase QueG